MPSFSLVISGLFLHGTVVLSVDCAGFMGLGAGGTFLYSFWNVALFCRDLQRSPKTSVMSCLMVQTTSALTWGEPNTS